MANHSSISAKKTPNGVRKSQTRLNNNKFGTEMTSFRKREREIPRSEPLDIQHNKASAPMKTLNHLRPHISSTGYNILFFICFSRF